MKHPDLERLGAWVHGFLEPAEAELLARHASECGDCAASAEALRAEAKLLSRELAPEDRLATLKSEILLRAGSPGRRISRGLLRQIPAAAAVLVGLILVLLSPGPRHHLASGRMALEDGREVSAPYDFEAAQPWKLRAADGATLRLSDRSRVELASGSLLGLAPEGPRGVQPELSAGEARLHVEPDSRPLVLLSPAGRVEAREGMFSVKIVVEEGGTDMKGMIAGALVTVLAGSASLSNAQGSVTASSGQSAVLTASEFPLFLQSQDKQEELLRKLEQLAGRVARLESEVQQLEEKNKLLKAQLGGNPFNAGGAWVGQPGSSGVRVIQSAPGAAPGSPVIIELEEKIERKNERRNDPKEK